MKENRKMKYGGKLTYFIEQQKWQATETVKTVNFRSFTVYSLLGAKNI